MPLVWFRSLVSFALHAENVHNGEIYFFNARGTSTVLNAVVYVIHEKKISKVSDMYIVL